VRVGNVPMQPRSILDLPPAGRPFWLLPIVFIMAFYVAPAELAQAVGARRGKQIL
jgi:hypothetical protein